MRYLTKQEYETAGILYDEMDPYCFSFESACEWVEFYLKTDPEKYERAMQYLVSLKQDWELERLTKQNDKPSKPVRL